MKIENQIGDKPDIHIKLWWCLVHLSNSPCCYITATSQPRNPTCMLIPILLAIRACSICFALCSCSTVDCRANNPLGCWYFGPTASVHGGVLQTRKLKNVSELFWCAEHSCLESGELSVQIPPRAAFFSLKKKLLWVCWIVCLCLVYNLVDDICYSYRVRVCCAIAQLLMFGFTLGCIASKILTPYLLSCPGSFVGRVLMPRNRSVMGSNPPRAALLGLLWVCWIVCLCFVYNLADDTCTTRTPTLTVPCCCFWVCFSPLYKSWAEKSRSLPEAFMNRINWFLCC